MIRLVHSFAERVGLPVREVLKVANLHLENLDTPLLIEIPPLPLGHKQIVNAEYTAKFKQRRENALRDAEIGLKEGRFAMGQSSTSQMQALHLLRSIYDQTKGNGEPIIVNQPGQSAGLTTEEAQAAWRYLKDAGLIQTFSMEYAARISAAGIDAIESASKHPNQPIAQFPGATFNILKIDRAYNSNVQQAGGQSSQIQNSTGSKDSGDDLSRLIAILRAHFSELRLGEAEKRKAWAQVETLSAQLTDEPNPVIVQEAGRTLRNIIEGAVGSLVASATQPAIWQWVGSTLPTLFS